MTNNKCNQTSLPLGGLGKDIRGLGKEKSTIAALATPAGGAIGVLRLSGPDAIAIADRLFVPAKAPASPAKTPASPAKAPASPAKAPASLAKAPASLAKAPASLAKAPASPALVGSATAPRFSTTGPSFLASAAPRTAHYGTLRALDGSDIDDVVATVYRAPHSYTGENCVELSCHGSAYILRTALQALIDAGARQALPGEYTQRAYLNGKMDLSQAEAVADLVAATNRATQQMALSQLKGHFSSALALLREKLLKMTSLLELELDFSDHEELEFADRTELRALATDIDHRITTLADSFRTGQALKQGIPVAIVGKTNVGKSTLLNALLHDDRAIVTDIPGTTRDTLEDCIDIHGVTFRFIDTAGIRHTTDRVEQIGIDRTYQALDRATIVLWVVASSNPLRKEGETSLPGVTPEELADMQQRCQDKHLIIVHNKADLMASSSSSSSSAPSSSSSSPSSSSSAPSSSSPSPSSSSSSPSSAGYALAITVKGSSPVPPSIAISAKLGTGLTALEDLLYRTADIPAITENSVIVTSARQYEALQHAHDDMVRTIEGMDAGLSSDLLAEDLRACITDLSNITGVDMMIDPEATLQNIFSHFCVGK